MSSSILPTPFPSLSNPLSFNLSSITLSKCIDQSDLTLVYSSGSSFSFVVVKEGDFPHWVVLSCGHGGCPAFHSVKKTWRYERFLGHCNSASCPIIDRKEMRMILGVGINMKSQIPNKIIPIFEGQ